MSVMMSVKSIAPAERAVQWCWH